MAKIDLSKLKGALKWLGVLRPYAVLLWPAVIALASMLVMAAALIMGTSFRQRVQKESAPSANQVKTLLESCVAAGQVEAERQYQEKYRQDANLIKSLAAQSTQRELLSYDIFPWPKDTSALLFTRFGDRFCQQVEGLIVKVNGQDCPGEAELKESLQRGFGGTRMLGRGSSSGVEESRVVEEICQARARSISVYANPADVSGYNFWRQYNYSDMNEGVRDCWFWQLGYWIIEDVFSTVDSLNAGSSSVYSSPVKRVERVGFVTLDNLFGTGGKTPQDRPKYVIESKDQLTESCTGRMSNERIDVVHFSMAVVVSAKDVVSFMEELCRAKEHSFAGYTGGDAAKVFKHNQISILESQIRLVGLDSREHQYYRYGSDAVLEVEMICEYIFNKKGYEAVKPEIAKKDVKPAA